MTAVTFDTLEFVESLKVSGFNEEQAKGMAGAIKKVQQANLDELATKQDLVALKGDLAELRVELKRDMTELGLRLKYDLTLRMGGMLAVTIGILVGSFFAIIRMIVPG